MSPSDRSSFCSSTIHLPNPRPSPSSPTSQCLPQLPRSNQRGQHPGADIVRVQSLLAHRGVRRHCIHDSAQQLLMQVWRIGKLLLVFAFAWACSAADFIILGLITLSTWLTLSPSVISPSKRSFSASINSCRRILRLSCTCPDPASVIGVGGAPAPLSRFSFCCPRLRIL